MMEGSPLLLALVPLAPLLLALMTALATGRGLALARALVPWAALPALTVGLMGDTQLRLDTALMGAMLALDATGRVFLLPMSVLWLTTALLMRPRLQTRDAGGLAILMLLAMAGTFAMAVAGDGLLFYTAAAIAGYALYGVLAITADTGGCRAARVLVIFLIAGDLMVFEVLMTLALDATAANFGTLRQALLHTAHPGLILTLLVAGFGTKLGLLGLHFWLPPVMVSGGRALAPAVLAFTLGAGLLGGLRLLPLGDLTAPVAAEVLRWMAWVTLAYALATGLLQTHRRGVLAYAAIALGGLWLAVLSQQLQSPGVWQGVVGPLATVLIQATFALAALLLMPGTAVKGIVGWSAVVLLAAAPGALAAMAPGPWLPVVSAMGVLGFLAASALLRHSPTGAGPPAHAGNGGSTVPAALMALLALAAAAYRPVAGWPVLAPAALVVVPAALAAALLARRFLTPRLPALPPGDLVVPLRHLLLALRRHGLRATSHGRPRPGDGGPTLAGRLGSGSAPQRLAARIEAFLGRWPVAVMAGLLLGLLLAGLGA